MAIFGADAAVGSGPAAGVNGAGAVRRGMSGFLDDVGRTARNSLLLRSNAMGNLVSEMQRCAQL